MNPMDRRKFLRLMAATAGGTILSTSIVGCSTSGASGDDPYPVLPSGYRFFRVKTTGSPIGGRGRALNLDYLYGGVHLASGGIVTVEGRDAARRGGLFQFGLDMTTTRPRIEWERTALLVGDQLGDGRVVSTFESYDVDDAGSIAAVLEADGSDAATHYGGGLYLDRFQGGFEPVLLAGDTFAGGDLYTTGILGDVDLHDDGNLLLVAHHERTDENEHAALHSVLHLPGGSLNDVTPLATAGEVIDGTDHELNEIGLIDLNDDGHYAYQGQTTPLAASGGPPAQAGTVGRSRVLTGNVRAPRETRLATASPVVAQDADVHYGPRVGPGGRISSIVDHGDEEEELLLGDRTLLRTGDPSPAGGTVLGLGPGSIGHDGALYYMLFSHQEPVSGPPRVGQSLMSFDGGTHRALLSTGDVLSDGGLPVRSILFGTSTEHVDDNHHLVMLCDFADDSMSVVVGLPT